MALRLSSLKIENYRNIEHLEIPELAQVNLLVGKNNVGKTSLLEAVLIYVSRSSSMILDTILAAREEANFTDKSLPARLEMYAMLFHGRETALPSKRICIETGNDFGKLELQLVPCVLVRESLGDGSVRSTPQVITSSDYLDIPDAYLGLLYHHDNEKEIIPLTPSRRLSGYGRAIRTSGNSLFIKSDNSIISMLGESNIGDLWERIALTEKEEFIIQALSIIEPIKRLTVLSEERRNRVLSEEPRNRVKILVQTIVEQRVSLKSMGDGMNRIFAIALAMVNAEGGFLLIDEFDNGLHYTVQESLWKVIFFLAQKLNVQVFATTHSLDCMYAFASICNTDEYRGLGKAIRLERYNEALFAETFSEDDLRKVVEHGIEIR